MYGLQQRAARGEEGKLLYYYLYWQVKPAETVAPKIPTHAQ